MNKNYIKIALAILLTTFFASCDTGFLSRADWGQSGGGMKTPKDVEDAVYSFNAFTSEEGVTGRGFMWFENCSDNLVTGRSSSSGDQIKDFMMGPSNDRDARDNWPVMYVLIGKANALIQNIGTVPKLPTKDKDEALGQAYFYRGFAYLWLAPFYGDNGPNGGIPIVTESTPIEGYDGPRPKSVLENYDMIIADMEKAGDMLPTLHELNTNKWGLAHKAAAWSFGARAALYAAQYDAKYYDKVLELTAKVMALTGADKRDLFDDGSANPFQNLWKEANNFSSEYIHSLLGNAKEGPKFHGMSFQNGGWGAYNTWGYFQPTLELYESFDSGDTRRDATILYPGDKITFVGVERTFGVDPKDISSTSGLTFRKFMSPWEPIDCKGTTVNTDGNNASNRLGTCLMRFADVLLMRAEALIWKNGEGNQEAKDILNRIRKRARLPQNSTATKAELKKQRRSELAFEFQPSRHIDLVRWGDAQTEYAKPLHGVTSELVNVGGVETLQVTKVEIWKARTFNPNVNHVFPIPSSIISAGNNLVQNKGY